MRNRFRPFLLRAFPNEWFRKLQKIFTVERWLCGNAVAVWFSTASIHEAMLLAGEKRRGGRVLLLKLVAPLFSSHDGDLLGGRDSVEQVSL